MEPRPNKALRHAIVDADATLRSIAAKAKIHEARFSAITRGRIVPSVKEQERIAKALHTTVDHLFPSEPEAIAS